MTWRDVPQRWFQRIQFAVLTVTILLGLSIAATPPERDVSTLTVIEQQMSADYWAWSMVILGTVALIAEIDMARRGHRKWVQLVSWCHIFLCAVLVSYSAAAMWGVLFRIWWNFGAPALGALLAYLHLVFKSRPGRA